MPTYLLYVYFKTTILFSLDILYYVFCLANIKLNILSLYIICFNFIVSLVGNSRIFFNWETLSASARDFHYATKGYSA